MQKEVVQFEETLFRKYVYSVGTSVIFVLCFFTDQYFQLSLALFILAVVMVLDRLGKGIVLRELIALYGVFVCVMMPLLGYEVYTRENPLARLWVRYMPVPEAQYFSFALPAMSLFMLAICWPINGRDFTDHGLKLRNTIERVKEKLSVMPGIGVYLMGGGIVMFYIARLLPDALQFVGQLVFWSAFPGALYLFYSPNFKRKKWVIGIFALFIFVSALQNGMFTLVAYMGITIFSFLFLGRKIAFWKKLAWFSLGCFFLILLQNVKRSYRDFIWRQGYEGSKAVLFTSLVADKLTDNTGFFSADAFFNTYYRTNQGYNIALVMLRFPEMKEYDYGANLSLSLASAAVPRLLWPDKPEAGGKYNMLYYTGIVLRQGWSTNVGPLGEAFGSFGPGLGMFYMFLLGLFIRWAYRLVFKLSRTTPLLVLWIPVIFYQVTYSAESDTLQILNSVVKSAIFVWMFTKIRPAWFGIAQKTLRRSAAEQPTPPVHQ